VKVEDMAIIMEDPNRPTVLFWVKGELKRSITFLSPTDALLKLARVMKTGKLED